MMKKIFFSMMALSLISALPAASQTVSDSDKFKLWNECKPVRLVVEGLSEDADKIDLKKENIAVTVRSRLRGARIYTGDLVFPYLYVVVSVVGKGFSINLELDKFVHDPLSGQSGIASTWLSGGTGTHADDPGYILSAVGKATDKFIDEYLRVNAPAC